MIWIQLKMNIMNKLGETIRVINYSLNTGKKILPLLVLLVAQPLHMRSYCRDVHVVQNALLVECPRYTRAFVVQKVVAIGKRVPVDDCVGRNLVPTCRRRVVFQIIGAAGDTAEV